MTKYEICDILDKIVFRDVRIRYVESWPEVGAGYLHLQVPCVMREMDRKYKDDPLPPMTSDFLQGSYRIDQGLDANGLLGFVIHSIASLLSHEIQENFYFRGERVFDPHLVGEFLKPPLPKAINANTGSRN